MSQAYYSNTIEGFLGDDNYFIIGKLNIGNIEFVRSWTRTTVSWNTSIELFKNKFRELILLNESAKKWTIFFEFEIPRLLSRIDAVIIAEDLIIVIEYKDDRKEYKIEDQRQIENYALDLKDFHLESRNRIIIPILLAPLAAIADTENKGFHDGLVKPVVKSNATQFATILFNLYNLYHDKSMAWINYKKWDESVYSPTPTIIQAAQALFAGHKVEAIAKSDANATNLSITTNYLVDTINEARQNKKKIVCFVTGVPGAGKTLVGLSIIHRDEFNENNNSSAAYFSGNGPLIKVLSAALAGDEYGREKRKYELKIITDRPKIKDSQNKVKSKIQNLHKFIKDGIRNKKTPFEKIVVFDEAQRCWNSTHFLNQTKRNQNRTKTEDLFEPVAKSEAEVLFEIMDRHEDWSVIVALVGEGQEINTGEGGIQEWGKVLREKYSHWEIYISEYLVDDNLNSTKKIPEAANSNLKIFQNQNLHLTVSLRSFRTKHLNNWVNFILENKPTDAKKIYSAITENYPIVLTRSLPKAKTWLRNFKSGQKRIGLVASSNALRLRPYGITTKESIDEVHWFLSEEEDIRSSSFLEIAATEYSIQGLEIDWACICWDADLRRNNDAWEFRFFVGDQWKYVSKTNATEKQYMLNSYRVLLTRAREGMIIWIPEGDINDPTRLPEIYDPIYNYLKECGVKEI